MTPESSAAAIATSDLYMCHASPARDSTPGFHVVDSSYHLPPSSGIRSPTPVMSRYRTNENHTDNNRTLAVSIAITIRKIEDIDVSKFAGGFSLDSGPW